MVEHEIVVGLVMERLAPSNPWGQDIWLPVQILQGAPETAPWTELSRGADRARYFAGTFVLKLYATHAGFYLDNLATERPRIWVAMRPDGPEPPVEIVAVTADPTEGEGYTETGTNVVEVIDMPDWMAGEIAAFAAEHHVERVFEKRKRDRRAPDLMGRRRPMDD
jgi:hypothetical protein